MTILDQPCAEDHTMGGERPIKPGAPQDGGRAKLPPPDPAAIDRLPEEVRKAWIAYMVNGFSNNEIMFRRTLAAFMKPYYLTLWMYGALFLLGLSLVVIAAITGLYTGQPVVALVFGGLGVGTFLLFFIRQPLQALEENLEFITWLGVAFNTYWTRLMYLSEPSTMQRDLKAAEDDYCNMVERLIVRHAELRGKRPGADLGASQAGNGGVGTERMPEPWPTKPGGQS